MQTKRVLGMLVTVMLLLTITTGLFLIGCDPPNDLPENEEESPPEEYDPKKNAEVKYEVIDETTLPQEVREKITLLQKEKGYFVFTSPDYDTGEAVLLMISAGEKPTGGYTLNLLSIKKENGLLQLEVEEKEPAADEIVIQALTYPTLVIELGREYEEYEIKNTENEPFAELSTKEIPERHAAQGTFNGQIDSNFIEISVNCSPVAYMLPEDLSWVLAEMLNSGDEVVFTYFKNDHGQRVILELNTKERAAMSRDVKGVFLGQIDSNSVEIEVDGETSAYVVAEQIPLRNFNEGDEIKFDYYEDQHGRLVINRMGKK